MANPYESLEPRAFWAPAVGRVSMFDIADLWRPKFAISPKTKVVTYGSCFAQHFSQALKKRGFSWVSMERAPDFLPDPDKKRFNYDVFSARTGNIYTTSLLRQWVEWASGERQPPDVFWEKAGRYFDPFRPNIEPDGFASLEEMLQSRKTCIEAFRRSITESGLFVFTLGLTESWFEIDPETGERLYEYPVCPGTIAGTFDPERHGFLNQDYRLIEGNLKEAIRKMRRMNSRLRFLLTVSPVPLTATNSGNHVLVATMQSKSILRAVVSAVVDYFPVADYFPSYEIINAPPYRGSFFEPNMRGVNPHGVDHVMTTFFAGLGLDAAAPAPRPAPGAAAIAPEPKKTLEDLVCEEEFLAVFGEKKGS